MNAHTILSNLKNILSSYESKCYLALLEGNDLAVSEIASLAGIPRASAYETLEKLMQKGLCIEVPGSTKHYRAADPAVLETRLLMNIDEAREFELQRLHEREIEIIDHTESEKERVCELVRQLRPRYEKGRSKTDLLNYIEIIKDPLQIHTRFMQLVAEAQTEILVFTKTPYSVPRETLREQAGPQQEAIERGVRIRGIYEVPTDPEERSWWYLVLERARQRGEEFRIIDELPMKMGVFDGSVVIFALEDPVSRRPTFTTQVVRHRALAASLGILFETLWERSREHRSSP